MLKVVNGSFHQGNLRFQESAGKQCTCCSLFSIAFTLIKSQGTWSSKDLDYIIEIGNSIYQALNVSGYVAFNELPISIPFNSSHFTVNYLNDYSGFISRTAEPSFLFESVPNTSTGLLFITKGLCFSITWTKRHYFLFDSHSRDNNGKPIADGASVLIKFSTRKSLQEHILSTYLTTTECVQFEVQYVNVDLENQGQLDNERRLYKLKTDSIRKKSEIQKEKCRKRKSSQEVKLRTCKQSKKSRRKQLDTDRVSAFKNAVIEGPYYICTVCNRCLYKKTVKKFLLSNYSEVIPNLFQHTLSFDGQEYICRTCDSHVSKDQVPPQAVINKLSLNPLPPEILKLNRLEKVLISKRILFKKIAIMPKGQQPKIKGALCNIPVKADDVCNVLPRNSENDGIVLVKLKRKLDFKGHVYFESVRPDVVSDALTYLKQNNPFYSNVLIDFSNINQDLLCLSDIDTMVERDEFPISLEKSEKDTEDENIETANPLDIERVQSDEMCVIPNIYNNDSNVLDIAPGENKKPESFFKDEYCEEQAFPFLLPSGKFGYQASRSVNLSPVKYFNQRLLNYTQRFASCSDYIFFAHYIMQQLNLFNSIQIATSKVKGTISASQLQNDFQKTVRSFICDDKGYMFMKSVKGTPSYWKHFLHDVLAMTRSIGIPSFFLTLSCADLKWNELVQIICRLNGLAFKESDLDYFKKCEILNSNPVLVARHFQFRVEAFFKELILHKKSVFGTVENYAIKVEFQFRGSPHIHSFIWVKNCIQLTRETKDEYVKFIDSIIRADLPDKSLEPVLNNLVEKYQIHRHSQSCRKYKNVPCRFNYGRFFTSKTMVAEPLSDELTDIEKTEILAKRYSILNQVKSYIDEYLDPSRQSYHVDSICNILCSLGISEEDYYWALSIAPDNDFEIHLYRPTDSCFVNNYFSNGLQAWEANLDIQPVFNYYKAVTYMCSYFSKSETESSLAMKKAATEYEDLPYQDRLKKLAVAFLTHRQCSLVEAVYQLMPELWLRKTFPTVTFANSNLPDKRYRICKNQDELSQLPEDSTDVFKKNSLDRYMDRPNKTFKGGLYSVLDDMCYAEFLAYYSLETKPKNENDCQPEILTDDSDEKQNNYPKTIPLMSSKEKMKCRSVKKILRYYTPNVATNPEAHAHHLLILFYPFRNESELMCNESNSYVKKLNDENVRRVVNYNLMQCEPFGNLVDQSLLNYASQCRKDDFAEQENDDLRTQKESEDSDSEDDVIDFQTPNLESRTASFEKIPLCLTNDEINTMISQLNEKQRKVFNTINRWARVTVKNQSSYVENDVKPLRLFITGNAGTGKSFLIKTIFASVSKTLNYRTSSVDKPKVLLLAPTGVAAVNISGTTIHSGLGIPTECRGLQVPKLPDKKKCSLRMHYEKLKMIIIDEISMVSNRLLLYIHQRLCEIFGFQNNNYIPFAGLTMIFVGDLFQLPPVLQKPIYAEYNDEIYNINHLWRIFKFCELTEVMRQKGDSTFIDLLNNVRIGHPTANDLRILSSRVINNINENYPLEALHIFAENEPAHLHNTFMLERIKEVLVTVNAIDDIPNSLPSHIYDKILTKPQSQTKGLLFTLNLKVGARVMLTSNIDISDKLINGQIGTVSHFEFQNRELKIIYVIFDDHTAGSCRKKNIFNNSVPIERITADIKTNARKDSAPVIKRTQFPLALSFACTVHKTQGLSLEKIVVNCDLLKQKAFNHGQFYVAISRATSLNGLFLTGNFDPKIIVADDKVTEEYNNLRRQKINENENENENDIYNNPLFSIKICNVRSLSLHVPHIRQDSTFTNRDMILCTETQLTTESLTEIQIDSYTCFVNNSPDRYMGLAVYHKENFNIVRDFDRDGISIFTVHVNKEINFRILLMYRKGNTSRFGFYETVQYLTTAFSIDLIVGDFNLNPTENLTDILDCYEQLVNEPTHLSGSILDCIFVKKNLLSQFFIDTDVESVFFSDHDAVTVNFNK